MSMLSHFFSPCWMPHGTPLPLLVPHGERGELKCAAALLPFINDGRRRMLTYI